MEIFSLGVIMSKASGASCHLPGLCHGDRYWYRLVFSWKTKHFYLFKPLTCSVNCTQLDKSTIFPIKFVFYSVWSESHLDPEPIVHLHMWMLTAGTWCQDSHWDVFHFLFDSIFSPSGCPWKNVRCVCVCVLKERQKKKSKLFIQYSGHMASEPLRTATKKANLWLSAGARIEAIEYDRYQPPPPPTHRHRHPHPLGQQ